MTQDLDKRIDELISHFKADGYTVDREMDIVTVDEQIGMRATHKTATIGSTNNKKKVYYIEGSPKQMGYMMGRLANEEIYRMCKNFVPNIFYNYLGNIAGEMGEDFRKRTLETVLDFGYWLSRPIKQDVPMEYLEELEGIMDGCNDTSTAVYWKELWLLNVGFDAMLSVGYTGKLPLKKEFPLNLDPNKFNIPVMCNGFCVSGSESKDYFYMGRDFQFSNGKVFQDVATMIIRKPDNGPPSVSVAAPGMVGTITGLNSKGIGIGVDMLPACNCNVYRPGLNSLLLTRYALDKGETCEKAAEIIKTARRGVSWLYIVGDGGKDRSCVVETGMTPEDKEEPIPLSKWAGQILKDYDQLIAESKKQFQNGVCLRTNNYQYPTTEYFKINERLMTGYKLNLDPNYNHQFNLEDFSEKGSFKECPGPYYFAPQREVKDNMVLVTNHSIQPYMRMLSMTDWIYFIAKERFDDIQSRYDKLNLALLEVLEKGYITYEEAKKIISTGSSLLNNQDNQEIGGAKSIMDLKKLTIESHYGYDSDQWIKLDLNNYISA